jgi:ubiquinone/menaquinone biosynthesis C-methylase UbiE
MKKPNFWGRYFKVYDTLNLLIPYQELLEKITEELDIIPGEKILDAGCGTGNLALKIKAKRGEVIGLDNCQEALDIYTKKHSSASTVLSDLSQSLPFPNGYFDKIVVNNTLYLFPKEKQRKILKEFFRILKEGGKIVISNPKKGFSPLKIYQQGIKQNIKKEGLAKTLKVVLKMLSSTLKILYYNSYIKKESSYCFLTPQEQKELLIEEGFVRISGAERVYANQGIMQSAYKV